MTTNFTSSEEMIRQAKETLRLAKEDFLPKVDEDLAQRGMRIGDAGAMMPEDVSEDMRAGMSAGMTGAPRSQASSQRMRVRDEIMRESRPRRVGSSTQDHLEVASRERRMPSVTVPASPVNTGSITGSGRWMRIAGNILLGFTAAIWVILLIGLIDNPDDLTDTLAGGALITLVPLVFGLVLRRAGTRRGAVV